MKTVLKRILAAVLILSAICLVGCRTVDKESLWNDAIYTTDTELGEGSKIAYVEIIVGENSVTFTIHTDEKYLADALKEHNLVEGEESDYGLYIKKLNGITADYDVDASYWSLTVNGEYSMSGASFTEICDGEHYEFTYTK